MTLTIRSFSSHVPLLRAVSAVIRPASILETGSGFYSTALFLNRDAFPYLTRLTSVENLPAWHQQVAGSIRDERHHYCLHQGAIALWVKEHADLSPDLAFVDDSKTGPERMETIKEIAGMSWPCPVVIHDYQYKGYQRVGRAAFDKEFIYVPPNGLPQTGMLWRGDAVTDAQLQEIRALLDQMEVVRG